MQRAACDGSTALSTFQGMLADEILLPQSAMDAKDPMAAAARHTRVCFRAGEPGVPDPWRVRARGADGHIGRCDYIEETRAGGHVAYWLSNRGGTI